MIRIAKLLAILATVVVLSACQPTPANNLVLICIDTVRYDGFMRTGLTDALDPWLARAQVYDDAVATGPWTMPSVASVLTGLYPVEHGAGRFEPAIANLNTDPPSPLAAEANTLAERLAGHGLRTGAFVSHPFFLTSLGLQQGFEVVRAAKGWEKDLANFETWRQRTPPERRFFAYLHFMEAHDRHKRNSDKLAARLDALDPAVRRNVRDRASTLACRNEQGRRCLQHQVYNEAILELRTGIATILDGLERSGDLDSTVVIVYSDHGEEFWDHRNEQTQWAEDPRGSYGFGHGQSLYQELLHVPLLAWIPQRKGARHPQPVSLVDVFPSALEWLGFEAEDPDTTGAALPVSSWWPWPRAADRVIYASGISYGPEKVAARQGSWKTVFTPDSERFEYYDLAADPQERQPLEQRDDLQMMFDTLVGDYLDRMRTPVAATGEFSREQIEALKAIGYLQGYDGEEAAGERPDEASRPGDDTAASADGDRE